MSISVEDFEKMTDFFRQKYFDNIPAIPCYLAKDRFFEKGVDASFYITQNDNYDEDEDDLLNSYEYSQTRVDLADGFGFEYGDPSWTDPLNKPKLSIVIKESLLAEPLRFVGTLLHELTHYWCWFCGYEHSDGKPQFEGKLKELGLPSNWEHRFIKSTKQWVDDFDYSKVQPYYDDFLQHCS